MSTHTQIAIINHIATVDREGLKKLKKFRKIPYDKRVRNENVIKYLDNLKDTWTNGTEIEKLSVIGWREHDCIHLFCQAIDNIEELKGQFKEYERHFGKPIPLKDGQLSEYWDFVNRFREELSRE